MMTRETLDQTIKDSTKNLIQMVRKHCWNHISDNCVYIISEIENDDKDFFQKRIERNKTNKTKTPKTIEETTNKLKEIYSNIYDINFYVYKAKKRKTIIEIQYFPKSLLATNFLEKVKENEPIIHCKISQPPYIEKNTEKFDINWEHNELKYYWKMFWWKRKTKKIKNVC